MKIIPAIDIIDGQCVRLTQGDYTQKTVYSKDPLEIAKEFEAAGLTHLHLVDLDGAKARHIVNHKILERIASNTQLIIDFGGGLKSDNDVRIAFESGASQIIGGTIAVKNSQLFISWIKKYGREKIILGADVLHQKIAVHGWQEKSEIDLFDFLLAYINEGIQYIICTDISKDGMLQGPSISLYQQIIQQFPNIKLIASGGIASLSDIHQLKQINCYGAISGKAIYENKISLNELSQFTINQ